MVNGSPVYTVLADAMGGDIIFMSDLPSYAILCFKEFFSFSVI